VLSGSGLGCVSWIRDGGMYARGVVWSVAFCFGQETVTESGEKELNLFRVAEKKDWRRGGDGGRSKWTSSVP
jgi:hypothetical protein